MGTSGNGGESLIVGKTTFLVDLERQVSILSQDGQMVSVPLADLFAFVAEIKQNRFLVVDHHKRTIFATPQFREDLGTLMEKLDGALVVVDTVNDEEFRFTTKHIRRMVQKEGG